MNYVKQAYELSAVKKQQALDLYKESVVELVNKNYVLRVSDAHTDLSSIFGTYWVFRNRGSGAFWKDTALYAEANIAFNYANLNLGISGGFIKLAKELVNKSERKSDKELEVFASYMDSILMATTAEYIIEKNLMFI